MPRGEAITWTRDQLERMLDARGLEAHMALADEFGCALNTIYSTRGRIKALGGIDQVLAAQETRYAHGYRGSDTLEEQLAREYLLRVSGAGRGGQYAQYTVTLPPLLAARFLDEFGRRVRFVPHDDGILIVPVVDSSAELPAWLANGQPAAASPSREKGEEE